MTMEVGISAIGDAAIDAVPPIWTNYATFAAPLSSRMEAVARSDYLDFIADENRRLTWAVIVTARARINSTNNDVTLFLATEDFTTRSADVPSQMLFQGSLKRNISLARQIALSGNSANLQSTSVEFVFDNSDEFNGFYPFDDLATGYTFAGEEITLYVGEVNAGLADFSQFFQVARYIVTEATIDFNEMKLKASDKMYLLDAPAQPEVYTGGNEEINNKRKPLALGCCKGISPAPVLLEDLIYQVSSRSVQAISAVYDMGYPLVSAGNFTTPTALRRAVIPGGRYATCTAFGLIRLGFSPVGVVTCDVEGDNVGGYIESRAGIIQRLLELGKVLAASDFGGHTFEVAIATRPAPVGYFLSHEEDKTAAQVCSELLPGGLMVMGFSRNGLLEIGTLEPPGIAPMARYDTVSVVSVNVAPLPSDFNPPSPHQRVTYGHNWTVLDSVAGEVTPDAEAKFKSPHKVASTSDEDALEVILDFPFAKELEPIQGFYDEADDAQDEANRRHQLFASERKVFTVEIAMRPLMHDLMDTIHVTKTEIERMGLGAGKLMRILTITDNIASEGDKAQLTALT